MSSNPIFFAPLRVPVTDPATGLMSRAWYLFFQAMFDRVGGSTGTPNDDLEQIAIEDFDISGADQIATARLLTDAQSDALDASLVDPPSTDATDALMLMLDAQDATGVGGPPTAKVGLTAIAGSAATLMRSDAAPALDVTITVTWSGVHTWLASSGSTTMSAQTPSTATFSIIRCTDQTASRKLEMVYCGSTSGGAYGAAAGSAVINAQGGTLTLSVADAAAMTLSTTGVAVVNRLGINGVTPPAQVTGWGVPAAPAVVATFPATPTLGQCGQAIGQIIKDLKAFGLYGA